MLHNGAVLNCGCRSGQCFARSDVPLPYCRPHTGPVSSFVYVTVTFFQTTMSIGWFPPSMCCPGPAVHPGQGEAAAKYTLTSSRAPSARGGRQAGRWLFASEGIRWIVFGFVVVVLFAPHISQHSDSWLVFSSDVTVPSAAALSRTPACMRSHQVHMKTCKLSLVSLYKMIRIDLFNEVQKHTCCSSQNSFS